MASSKKSQPCSQTDNTPECCPLCGGPNACKLCTTDGGSDPCWCASVKIPDTLLACVPEKERNVSCICSNCVLTHMPQRVSSAARKFALILLLLQPAFLWAITFTENFSANPASSGWQIFGTNNLFTWDSTNQNLRVTWDSSKPNNYFHRPLGTILTPNDDFSLSFDLTFDDYASGVNPAKPGTFEAAIGFLNLEQATKTNFFRGAGVNATYGPLNLVEFDFFPAFDTFSPTIAQTIVGTNHSNSSWLYNHDNQREMTPGETFHVTMNYSAATRILATTVTNNGAQYGDPQTISLPAGFDFRVTALSISSYSDAIQPPPPGSILAHGLVDNLIVVTPPPPVEYLSGGFGGANWRVQFTSRTNWLYTLERSSNCVAWTNASPATPGNAAQLTLSDTNPPAGKAFYRVRANRP